MDLIADKNGVDVLIPPVKGGDEGLALNVDFNFGYIKVHELDHRCKEWDLKLMDGKRHVGSAKFTAFQFIADGVDRRTISLKSIGLEPRHRGQKKSYDVARYVIATVTSECDRDWGEVSGKPVMFIEKKDLTHVPEAERQGLFDFLKKIGEKILGIHSKPQPTDGELTVSVIGDNISLQLIEGHLVRSNALQVKK